MRYLKAALQNIAQKDRISTVSNIIQDALREWKQELRERKY